MNKIASTKECKKRRRKKWSKKRKGEMKKNVKTYKMAAELKEKKRWKMCL